MTALLEQFNNQKETLIMIDRELAALHTQQAKTTPRLPQLNLSMNKKPRQLRLNLSKAMR